MFPPSVHWTYEPGRFARHDTSCQSSMCIAERASLRLYGTARFARSISTKGVERQRAIESAETKIKAAALADSTARVKLVLNHFAGQMSQALSAAKAKEDLCVANLPGQSVKTTCARPKSGFEHRPGEHIHPGMKLGQRMTGCLYHPFISAQPTGDALRERFRPLLPPISVETVKASLDRVFGAPFESFTPPPQATQGQVIDSIEARFSTHKVGMEQFARMQAIRLTIKEAARAIVAKTKSGREQSLALTHLEEASFWAIAAIGREGK